MIPKNTRKHPTATRSAAQAQPEPGAHKSSATRGESQERALSQSEPCSEQDAMAVLRFEKGGAAVVLPDIGDTSSSSSDADRQAWPVTPRVDRRVAQPEPVTTKAKAAAAPTVTPWQVVQFIGVVVSFPIRVLVGLGATAVGVLAQTAVWIKDAISPPPPDTAPAWNREGPVAVFPQYGKRMVIKQEDPDRYGGLHDPIGPDVRLYQATHGVADEDVIDIAPDTSTQITLSPKRPDQLGELGLSDRLDIAAHGTADAVAGLSPAVLAQVLQGLGLRRIGVINVGSCNAGSQLFLTQLGHELDQRGIQFGWIAGAKGVSANFLQLGRIGGWTYRWSLLVLPWKKLVVPFMSQSLHRQRVPGNTAVDFPGTVFDSQRPWWRIASRWTFWR